MKLKTTCKPYYNIKLETSTLKIILTYFQLLVETVKGCNGSPLLLSCLTIQRKPEPCMLPAGPPNRSYTKYTQILQRFNCCINYVRDDGDITFQGFGNSKKKRKGTAFEALPAALAGERAAVVGLPLLKMLHPKGFPMQTRNKKGRRDEIGPIWTL